MTIMPFDTLPTPAFYFRSARIEEPMRRKNKFMTNEYHRTPIKGSAEGNLAILRLKLNNEISNLIDSLENEWSDSAEYVDNMIEELEKLEGLPWDNAPQFNKLIDELKVIKERIESISDDDEDEIDEDQAEIIKKLVDMAKKTLASKPDDEEAKKVLDEYGEDEDGVESNWDDIYLDVLTFVAITLPKYASLK